MPTKMTDLTTLLDNNGKLAVYTGRNIHGLYHYLEMIVSPTTLTTSGQRSYHFGTSYYTNTDTSNLQQVIAALRVGQKIIFECCGKIRHKADV